MAFSIRALLLTSALITLPGSATAQHAINAEKAVRQNQVQTDNQPHQMSERARQWDEVVLAAQRNPQEVLADGNRMLERATQQNDKAGQLKALRTLVIAYGALETYIGRKEELEYGLALARELNDFDSQCEFLDYLAWKEWSEGRSDAASRILDEETLIAEAHPKECTLAEIYVSRSFMAKARGAASESMSWLSKAYAGFEQKGDEFGMARTLQYIGTAFSSNTRNMEDQAKAADYFHRAFALFDPKDHQLFAIENNAQLAMTYYHRKDYANAMRFLEVAHAIATEMKHPLIAQVEYRLGQVELAAHRYAAALAHFDRAFPGLSGISSGNKTAVEVLTGRAVALAQLGRREESLDTLAAARKAQRELGDRTLDVIYFAGSNQIHAHFKDYESAYRDLLLLQAAEREAIETANAKHDEELKVRFDVRLRESENELLRVQQKEAESKRQVYALVSLVSLLLLLGLAFYLRRRAVVSKIELQHQKALAEAEASANRAKTTFLANMSHELRSPLNAILGFTRLLARESSLPAEAQSDLRIVVKSSEHLHGLINQVLDLSKIESGHIALIDTDVDLHALLDDVEDMFSLLAYQKGLQLIVDRPTDLPRYIRIDAGKLRQVLINLLNNALKFTAQGSVTLRVGKTDRNGRLAFEVLDTGPGIASDELSKLGQPFVQAQAGRQANEGSGLGLTISRGFVQLMGGSLNISSEPGKGSTFAFDIKIHENQETHAVEYRRVAGLAGGQPRYRILAVDDREEGRQLLVRMLTSLGFEVREASNGEEAIAIWANWEPHVICMDLRMPVMDGREATRRIRGTEKGKATVIIALTASSFEDGREAILADGCNDLVHKPFREHELFDALHRHLGVEFVYEKTHDRMVAALPDPRHLEALPPELQTRLRVALLGLDVDAIASAIASIREYDAGLADALAGLAANFDYEKIGTLLPASNETGHE
ncbi:hybrid sensor histidine kinase/response regulator [Noviherbaspirillum saxi]|uniref:Virulence sensor protein BvgS n=1 Tax=Noviherbaspirillum saxi TaxID=2320863 RepID=A0A3A3FI81_9BURK|nr:ATP-binding protein [Noviherbaspirillum saxi]RJF92098.1 response regulator [Noviherbaspirillum saxi]